jgi:hypothetical protein
MTWESDPVTGSAEYLFYTAEIEETEIPMPLQSDILLLDFSIN